jgi:pyruvate dehydrogenase E1 component alpha subunit
LPLVYWAGSCIAGAMSVMKQEDSMITAYRDHAHMLWQKVQSQSYYGRNVWQSNRMLKRQRRFSMHMFDKRKHFYGGHGIVGGQVPLGCRCIAFAEKYKGTEFVNITYMGDGAVRQGALTETFNMAALMEIACNFYLRK